MCIVGELSEELPSKAARLFEHNQATEIRVPQSLELVTPTITVDPPEW